MICSFISLSKRLAVPSYVFKNTFPAKPSVTTISQIPSTKFLASTLPIKLSFLLLEISLYASSVSAFPLFSSVPTLSKPMLGFSQPNINL